MTPLTGVDVGQYIAKSPSTLQEVSDRRKVMSRAVTRATNIRSRITVFPYKIKGLLDMALACVCVSAELVGVAELVRHAYLHGIRGKFVALKTEAGVLLCIQGSAEQHEWIDTTNGLIKGVVAVGTFSYVVPCA